MKDNSLRARIVSSVRVTILTIRHLADVIAIELRRLNRARMDSAVLASMLPRDQRKAVKAALAAHHRNRSRCC
jgi:hypothetical protein